MTKAQAAAYVHAQAVAATAEIEGMKACNAYRGNDGTGYHEDDFRAVIDKYQLGHNDIFTIFNGTED